MKQFLTNILESLVKLDNILVWDGKARPFFETYDIRLNDPAAGWALWLKYALCCPASNKKESHASLTAAFADRQGTKTVLSEKYNLGGYDIVHADQFIGMGNSFLSLAEAAGLVSHENENIKWEFSFEDPVSSLRVFPHNLFYCFRWPRAKFLQPRFKSLASGQFFVNLQKKTVRHFPVYQAHSFGPRFPLRWANASCINFKEDSSAAFQALSFLVTLGRTPLTALNFFCLQMEGQAFYANSPFRMFLNKSAYNHASWQGQFVKNGFRFVFTIQAEPRTTIGICHNDISPKPCYVYISTRSRITINVQKKTNHKWTFYKTLSSRDGCYFETGSPNKIKELCLDLEQGP